MFIISVQGSGWFFHEVAGNVRRINMKVMLFFDQIQAGAGGKEQAETPLSVSKGGVGAFGSFKDYLPKEGLHVLATIYSGTDYFKNNKAECLEKITKLLEKHHVECLVCGPCYNYPDYTKMACEVAEYVQNASSCRTLVMCSKEMEDITKSYEDKLTILTMPKKGGVGLSDAFRQLAKTLQEMSSAQ